MLTLEELEKLDEILLHKLNLCITDGFIDPVKAEETLNMYTSILVQHGFEQAQFLLTQEPLEPQST